MKKETHDIPQPTAPLTEDPVAERYKEMETLLGKILVGAILLAGLLFLLTR